LILREHNGLSYYQFPHLAAFSELRHGVFTRWGGVSRGPFRSLNISFGLGDEDRRVRENRQRMSRCFGGGDLVFVRQEHGNRVAAVDAGRVLTEDLMPAVDATVTAHPRRLLAVQVADCQPVLLYDPVRRVAAAVHSGWRGSIADIVGRTVAAMQEGFGCRPRDLHAGVGPSLGPCCAEFVNYRREIPEPLWRYRGPGDFFDFWALSRDQLTAAGVPAEQVVLSGLCTRCRTDIFFSYRGEKRTGRFAAVIGMSDGR
jgi:YfiH family protein